MGKGEKGGWVRRVDIFTAGPCLVGEVSRISYI